MSSVVFALLLAGWAALGTVLVDDSVAAASKNTAFLAAVLVTALIVVITQRRRSVPLDDVEGGSRSD